MSNKDGLTPDGDAADKNAEGKGDASEQNADPKSDKSGTGQDPKPENGKFYTQDELDAIIAKRVNRATKDLADKAKLTETERLQKERDEALKLVQDRDLKDAFIAKAGLDYAKAGRLFNLYRDEIETDANGKATNLAEVLKMAKADFPEIFTTVKGTADGSEGSGDKGKAIAGDMNSVLRKMAGRG